MPNDPDFKTLQTIQKLYTEDNRRKRRSINLETRRLSALKPDQLINITPPGTLVIILSQSGSGFLGDLRRSLDSDLNRAESLMYGMRTKLSRRTPIPFADAVDTLVELNSLVDIRHGGRTIATNVPVISPWEVTIFTFPYLGGPLAREGLRLVEKYLERPIIDGTAILRSPEFSSVQAAANELVGDDERELQIGAPSMCYAGSAATVAVTVALVTVGASGAFPDEDMPKLSGASAPDYTASVETLIQKRRQALAGR